MPAHPRYVVRRRHRAALYVAGQTTCWVDQLLWVGSASRAGRRRQSVAGSHGRYTSLVLAALTC